MIEIQFPIGCNLIEMLCVKEERHLAYFDDIGSYFASYQLELQPYQGELPKLTLEFWVAHQFKFEWQSSYFACTLKSRKVPCGRCPFSLENYFDLFQDPHIHHFELQLLPDISPPPAQEPFGKLIIRTTFRGNQFKLPVRIRQAQSLANIESSKMVTVISPKDGTTIVCSGELKEQRYVGEVTNFVGSCPSGCELWVFGFEERVEAGDIIVIRGRFETKEFLFDRAMIRIVSYNQDTAFMPGLLGHLQQLKTIMGEIQPLTIIQNVETLLEDGHRLVFYADAASLYSRIFRSYLYDKIKDRWLVEGMVGYNRSNKHFQQVIKELIELVTEGQELVPLQNDTFYFDPVWRLKAVFLYHVLSNFKSMRDYGSASLATLVVQEARKAKVTSQLLFKRLKNKYGLKNFRTIYEQQFVKATGLNRVFYELIDIKRENRVKIIVRQKSLANKLFRLYNMFRIKLEQQFGLLSPLMERIVTKNRFQDRKKQLSGPLAVPKFLRCQPYFRGHVAVQTDASQMPFQLELREENIVEQKQNVTSKVRAPVRKVGEGDRSYQGFGWMMIDTAHVFPAVYKNQHVHQSVLLEKIKRRYDSEQQEIKVLNCISSRDHASSLRVCKALIDKVRINPNAKENCSINVKRRILQLLPLFLSKADDFALWEDILQFLRLYEPPCHDYSEQGGLFLLSLVEAIGQITFKKQMGYYFENFHRIMLLILHELQNRSDERQERLKCALFTSLMQWPSRYSLQILEEVKTELSLARCRVRSQLAVLQTILRNLFPYIKLLRLNELAEPCKSILDYVSQLSQKDITHSLFAIQFGFELQQRENSAVSPLAFLKHAFGLLQNLRGGPIRRYGLAVQCLRKVLNGNRKVYGLQLQLSLTENESYFIAEYLWCELTSSLSASHPFVRLQWIKVYRTFYFYFIPIVTLKKIKDNAESRDFRTLPPEASADIVGNIRDFFPDIRWFSGYDSRSAKELKAKYEQMNENKRKKKFEEYSFSENNVITIFIKQHPGRESWDELARQALRIFISIYEDKEQKSEKAEAQRHKTIQEGFKKIEQKLKRGRMPDFYSYQQLKEEIGHLMEEYRQQEKKVTDILLMVDKALSEISQEKSKREAQLRDQMRIIINLDSIHEEQEDQQQEQPQEEDAQNQMGDENEPLFADQVQLQPVHPEADGDMDMD